MASTATIKDVKRQRKTRQSCSTPELPTLKTPRRSHRNKKKANGPTLRHLQIYRDVPVQISEERTKDREKERPIGNHSEFAQDYRHLTPGHKLKHRKLGGRQICSGILPENNPNTVHDGSSQDGDPIRPAKRRRTEQGINISHQSLALSRAQPPSKPAGPARVTEFRKATFSKRVLGVKYRDETKDSYREDPQWSTASLIHIAVEIPVYGDFDREAYAKVSASSSQSTTVTSLKALTALSPTCVIPDSQDQPDLSSDEALENARQFVGRCQRFLSEHSGFNEDKVEVFSQERQSTQSNVSQDSSSAELWQGVQTLQALPLTNSQATSSGLDFEIFQDIQKPVDKPGDLPRELSQGELNHSVLSQRKPNSQQIASHARSSQTKRVKGDRHKASRDGQPSGTLKRPSLSSATPCSSSSGSNKHFPSRPSTPLESNMADIGPGRYGTKLGYIDELRAARNKVREKFNESQRSSSIDPKSPPASPQISGQMLPMRENITDAAASMEQMDETEDVDDDGLSNSDEVTLRVPTPGPMEKFILLPIVSMVREIYEHVVMKRKREIEEFLSNEKVDPELIESLDTMIEELKLLIDHQDLITEESSSWQSNASDETRAKWATTCSSKCLFVYSLLEKMRHEEKLIAILARPGRMLDILESILRWYNFSYERKDCSARPGARGDGSLNVVLLPTGSTHGQYGVIVADAVIAFDESFYKADHHIYSTIRRVLISGSQKLSPLISLVVAYSAEHIELCLPKTADHMLRKISLVDFTTQTRGDLGKLLGDYPSLRETAVAVAQYLHGSTQSDTEWPLPEIPDITGLQPSSNPVTQKTSGLISQPDDSQSSQSVPPSHGSMKRTLRADSITGPDPDLTKRMRMTPTPGEILSSGEVTRVSDSIGTQSLAKSATPISVARDAIAHATEINDRQSKQISALVEKVNELEAKLKDRESTGEHLTVKVKDLEHRLDDHISTVKRLQLKLQEAIIERGKFQVERDEANAQAAQSITSRNAEFAEHKEEKTNLEKELIAARTALANPTIPEAAALAQVQGQVQALQSDNERLEKQIPILQHQLDFTRDVYQKASSHTTQLDQEISGLKAVNTDLQRKASETRIRVAEIQRANESREREARIAELEALLRNREAELRKKIEELKIKTNGRRETRGTSVPRSPRMGGSGAMSPRPGFSRVAAGSRGASPAPGDHAHGGRERDPLLFPPSGLGSGRWDHLNG